MSEDAPEGSVPDDRRARRRGKLLLILLAVLVLASPVIAGFAVWLVLKLIAAMP